MTPDLEKPNWSETIEQLRARMETPEYQARIARIEQQRAAEAEAAAAERKRDARRALLARERVSFPEELEDALVSGGDLKQTKALQAVQRWLDAGDVPATLVLSGGTGCGKTVAAAWGLVRCGGRWRTAQALCRLFAAQFGEQLEEQEGVVDCRLLVIDDLGTEHDAQRMGEVLLEVIDQRQNASRTRTIISTNLSRKDFAARYSSERIASRFAHPAGRVAWVSDQGADLRRAK